MSRRNYIYGGHIRAKVTPHPGRRGLRWSAVVTNTATGATITSDAGWASHEEALNDVGRWVAAARLGWSLGFGKKKLVGQ